MTQITLGFQLGGQVYSQIIFFQDRRAFDEFTGGNFEFLPHVYTDTNLNRSSISFRVSDHLPLWVEFEI